jgi:hypothetical protein
MTTRTRWSLLGLAAILVMVAGMLLPMMKKASNCGGNSAALAACSGYIMILHVWALDHADQSFHLDHADTQTRHGLARLPGASWIRLARLMARVDDVRVDAVGAKRVIMVCDRAYDNVPQRMFGTSPMAHAVAYSTGEIGLISPDEFVRLDLSGFVDLRTLAETQGVNQQFPASTNGVPVPRHGN